MALREVLKHPEVRSATLVDIDPDMVDFARRDPVMRRLNHNALSDRRVSVPPAGGVAAGGVRALYQETGETRTGEKGQPVPETVMTAMVNILHLDADKFIETARGKYNVILVDFPDPGSIELAKLYSREFYLKLRNVLSEKGMVAVQATSPYHAKEAFLCIVRTLEAAGFDTLPYHDNVPSFGDWGWILAWKKQAMTRETVENRIASMDIGVKTRYISPEVFKSARVFGKGRLESRNREVNTLMHPVILDLYTREGWKID